MLNRLLAHTNKAPASSSLEKQAPRAASRGQALVEFAFSFSIFALMFFGLIFVGIIFAAYLTTNAGASEGVHYLITHPLDTNAAIAQQVCTTSPFLGGSAAACNNMATVPNTNFNNGAFVAVACPPASPQTDLYIFIEPYTRDSGVVGSLATVTVCYHVPLPTLSFP